MPTYYYDASESNAHPTDPDRLHDSPDADALADADKVRPVTRDAPEPEQSDADAIEAGVCPWCDDYEGEHVGRHASSAHPDAWGDYSSDD